MKFLKWLLFPFAILYGWIMALRNLLYDRGIFKSEKFDLPVISVGNLTVGGTGKTPHVEFLLRLLGNKKKATLSRGYKRSTKGFVLANEEASAATIGDEPFQYYLDFPETTVTVCEKRAEGIIKIQELKPEAEVIILDDAFQHRAVTPTLNLLITDFFRRFDTDFMLPTGLLREPRCGAKRADAVLVSKCPENLAANEREAIKNSIRKYTKPGTPVFFTTYKYGSPVGFGKPVVPGKKIMLVTGIANPEPLIRYLLEQNYTIISHLNWPDHHHYTAADLEKIRNTLEQLPEECSIFTTRKDAVKLMRPDFGFYVEKLPFFYLPIEVAFLADQPQFEQMVLSAVKA
ncbi:tetraacyldisaccharide 4'-kinase [Adhaeribacter soli]|uniref:Tetraacyldisaccharide 4'-kinase n=1 Tax=Adhaeribacter soli TaxID=2607655 RepID=A0A5N1J5X1_9BACT|nr:tetraacyldisaccharide 4'-kinase [Adhaeribacter soli]KAA9346114.1 tetraacyldisaccharide 4'-kinase [Adhaeribacter soli]